jgi:hypothetical protein
MILERIVDQQMGLLAAFQADRSFGIPKVTW